MSKTDITNGWNVAYYGKKLRYVSLDPLEYIGFVVLHMKALQTILKTF